jgi:hypothetical protein
MTPQMTSWATPSQNERVNQRATQAIKPRAAREYLTPSQTARDGRKAKQDTTHGPQRVTRLDVDERDAVDHRRADDRTFAKWLPVLIQIAMMLLALGVLYGSLNGRLSLIEYRLGQVEVKVSKP